VTAAVSPRQRSRARTFAQDILSVARRVREAEAGRAWPAEKWQADPVGFATTILGVRLWSAQVEILESIRDHKRVAVAGGRKIGKDFALAVAALWWYASFPDARVFMTAVSAKQVRDILYREVRQRFAQSGRCAACREAKPDAPAPCTHSAILTGKVGELPATGITAADFREIKGQTADAAEGLAGFSGARLLAIIDEASGYPDDLHVAIRGNLAASGCREVLISNPTRARGFFFDAFHKGTGLYKTIQVSSESSPNLVEGREVFPALASGEWIEDMKRDYGEESALYKIHVKGEFVLHEQGAIFPVHAIEEAVRRWQDTPAEGPLQVGVDPAGEGGKGDESGFAGRRGKKLVELVARRGLSPEGHVIEVLGIIAKHGQSTGERARVVVDREGETGAKVWGAFVAYVQAQGDACPFDLVGVRSSERAVRQPLVYDRVRDELCAVLADWFRDGGAIPDDPKLAKELHVFKWTEHVSGRTKAIPKDKIREELGRSPDRADAVSLACWGPQYAGATTQTAATEQVAPDPYESTPDRVFDPYAGASSAPGHDRVFDPYK
jgi:hypothetical protein